MSAAAPPARRVLVADDSAVVREMLVDILLDQGLRCAEAADGVEALALARQEPFDLVITDIQMPNLDGLGLVRALKDDPHLRTLPVVMLTASQEEGLMVAGLGLGADDYLRKPFSPQELVLRVQNIFNRMRDKALLLATFEKYVAPEVVTELLERGDGLELYGQKKPIVVLFCDIRRFTEFSEARDPREVVGILNEVLTIVTEVVMAYRGTLDKFLGDGAMVFFGAPIAYGDEAQRAVRSAVALLRRLDAWNQARHAQDRVQLGVGIHAGEAVVGNIGSTARLSYTAIGSCVNVASRLVGVAGAGEILVSREVRDGARLGGACDELTPVMLKGLKGLFQIFSVPWQT